MLGCVLGLCIGEAKIEGRRHRYNARTPFTDHGLNMAVSLALTLPSIATVQYGDYSQVLFLDHRRIITSFADSFDMATVMGYWPLSCRLCHFWLKRVASEIMQ